MSYVGQGFSPANSYRTWGRASALRATGRALALHERVRDRPTRLADFAYCGTYRYHVRVGTWDRRPYFADATIASLVSDQLLRQARGHHFAIHAYCLMPDHAHVFLSGTSHDSKLPRLVSCWKQHTGYRFAARRDGCRLWQPGYFERVLREDESDETVARYIVANPLRAGLSERVGQYPYAWCAWPLE